MIGLAAGSVDSKRSSTATTTSSSRGDSSSSITDADSADSSNLEVDRIYSAQLQQYQSEHRAWAAGKEARAEAERELRGIEQKAASLADEKPIKPYYGAHEWETRDGKYKTQAELIDTDNVDVTLKKSDGKIVTVSKETLIHSSRLIVEKAFTELSAYKTRLSEWEPESIKLDDLRRVSEKKFAALNKPEPQPPSREKIVAEREKEIARKEFADAQKKIADAEKKREADRKAAEEAAEKAELELDFNGLVLMRKTVSGSQGPLGGTITGIVENRRRRKLTYAQITFNLYDDSGAQVGTAIANINGLEPGGKWKFEAVSFGQEFTKYKISELTGF
ncbi:MAG: FxLYD domain-containing protein [Pirellula sp.]|jgi:hypothetical protein